jgi:hypothetical protein
MGCADRGGAQIHANSQRKRSWPSIRDARMVTEKIAALTEAQAAAGTAAIRGNSHRVAKKALGVYKKRVRRNKLRLTRKLGRGS